MSELPSDLIEEINALLGVEGRPYSIFSGEGRTETNCYQWSQFKSSAELFQSVSHELGKAMAEAQESQIKLPLPFSDPMKRMRSHIRRNNPNVLEEYDQLTQDLEDAESRWQNPLGEPPSIPPELNKTTEKIRKQVEEEFGNQTEFNVDKYIDRIRQLWEEEPEEVRLAMEAFQPEIQAYVDAPREAVKQRLDRLFRVRPILKGRPFFAYGNVIVAPVEDQFEALRIEKTNGDNYGLSTEDIITSLRQVDQEFGIDIINAGFDSVTFSLDKVPTGINAEQLGEFLFNLCPDLLEPPFEFPDGMIQLWWD